MRMRGALAGVLLGLLLLPAAAAAKRSPIELLDARALSPRLQELTLSTPALPAPTRVRVLLPDGYDPERRRYPVLYLLHGGAGSYRDWSTAGAAVEASARRRLIVVMPDGGHGGWYTDWKAPGLAGQPRWETYHVGQLIPWIDRHFATVAKRRGRAIAGLSMGGFGALSYASRHPDLFVAASSWSGAVDTNSFPLLAAHVVDLITGLDGGLPGSPFGLRETEELHWRGHNPWDLAANLRGMTLSLRTGNGAPGGRYGGSPDLLEIAVHEMGVSLHRRLEQLGIDHTWDDYGPGAHSYAYWNRDLRLDLPAIMRTFRKPPRVPARIDYRTIEPRYEVFGWRVEIDRAVDEFSSLERAGRRGFTLAGSGSATVTTPPEYRPGRAYSVRIGGERRRLRAGPRGRLRIALELGPSNQVQQYAVPVLGLEQRRFETAVTIGGRR